MLFKILISIIIIAIFIYLLIGAVTTYIMRRLNPLKKLDTSLKTIYLTFDDGINNEYTPILLDVLSKYQVKVSFFILASSVEDNIHIIKRMKEDGHIIGFHSYNHKNQILQLPYQVWSDYKKSINIFKKVGIDMVYYRPPWGHSRPLGLLLNKVYNLKMVLWNVIVQDWQKDTSVEILSTKLKDKVHDNAVICLHDGRGKNSAPMKTIKTLDVMIPIWKKEGYTFETVDKIY